MRELDEGFHPLQLKLLSEMSVAQRVQLWNDISGTALELRWSVLRKDYPELPERELLKKFATLLHGPELANKAYERDSA